MQEILIVGTGSAGLTAAIYAARAGFKPIVFAGLQHGGQLTTTSDVENFPGFKEAILGPELMQNMITQAQRVGAKIINRTIMKVEYHQSVFRLYDDNKQSYQAKAVIICTGATARLLGLPKEQELMGKGISTCATCDGFFYRNQRVAVIGGGDSAMEEALYLANICSQVLLIHRRDFFRASSIMLQRAKKHQKIKFMLPYTIVDTVSDSSGLTGIVTKNTETGESCEVVVDGLFYGIGHEPNSQLFKDYVDIDNHGYIKVTNCVETKTPGLYAAGDIADPVFKQAVTAASMGCQAAILATKYLENNND